jgi:hypothetical protein
MFKLGAITGTQSGRSLTQQLTLASVTELLVHMITLKFWKFDKYED